jgi:hypothetical protein
LFLLRKSILSLHFIFSLNSSFFVLENRDNLLLKPQEGKMSTTEKKNAVSGDNKENESESCIPTKKSSGANKAWKISDFDMGKALGKGRFGHVYCARETKSGYVVGK